MLIDFKLNNLISRSVWLVLLMMQISCDSESTQGDKDKPNVIILYLDDLGYGDVSAYGATELATPNIDRLANGGIRFTNGYATSATCTPSRYGLLTGIYPWRNKQARILSGSAPMIIDSTQLTLPKLFQSNGYQTAIVGKWHLGLGSGNIDWNQRIPFGPNEVGFDYSCIMAATQDRVPTVYIEDGTVIGLDDQDPIEVDYKHNFEGEPTGKSNPEMLTMYWHHGHNNSIVNGIARIGYMKGGEKARWSDIDMADFFLDKAQRYVKENKEHPFFLYYAMQQPHVPRTPHPRFIGKSGMGPRVDVILEADWCIGAFLETLENEELLQNTLIILSSDNGPVLNDGYYDEAVEKLGKHKPSGELRGGKYSLFEGGTRVPFITYWQGQIFKGKVSEAIISQMDLLASFADMFDSDVSSIDSQPLLNTLLGKTPHGRDSFILEANGKTALRKDNWLMIPPYQGDKLKKKVNIESGIDINYQLYNLKLDHSQQKNVAVNNPEELKMMISEYEILTGKSLIEL